LQLEHILITAKARERRTIAQRNVEQEKAKVARIGVVGPVILKCSE
jgi:hypothetical protein